MLHVFNVDCFSLSLLGREGDLLYKVYFQFTVTNNQTPVLSDTVDVVYGGCGLCTTSPFYHKDHVMYCGTSKLIHMYIVYT
jgi:hypothetical protein